MGNKNREPSQALCLIFNITLLIARVLWKFVEWCGDVVDVILVDRKLGGVVKDIVPVGFAPGEIKFADNKVLFGGIVRFQAVLWFSP